jgi:hypothetical protein
MCQEQEILEMFSALDASVERNPIDSLDLLSQSFRRFGFPTLRFAASSECVN